MSKVFGFERLSPSTNLTGLTLNGTELQEPIILSALVKLQQLLINGVSGDLLRRQLELLPHSLLGLGLVACHATGLLVHLASAVSSLPNLRKLGFGRHTLSSFTLFLYDEDAELVRKQASRLDQLCALRGIVTKPGSVLEGLRDPRC